MMHVIVLRIVTLLAVLALANPGRADEPIRAELIRLQQETGLTLASFYRNVHTVKFTDRTVSLEVVFHPGGIPQEGQLSRDGAWIAMSVAAENHEYLAVGRRDGSGFRQYPKIGSSYAVCWSYDDSTLVLLSGALLDLASGVARKIDESAYLTSQCWSPSGKQLVYSSAGGIRVYDLAKKESHEIAKGEAPTWSPDGQWIAFVLGDAFYAIRPSGEEKKLLFKSSDVRTPLWWSPDSRFVAYLCSAKRSFWEVLRSPPNVLQLRVRRMADGAEDYVTEVADKGYVPNYQWVQNNASQSTLKPDANVRRATK